MKTYLLLISLMISFEAFTQQSSILFKGKNHPQWAPNPIANKNARVAAQMTKPKKEVRYSWDPLTNSWLSEGIITTYEYDAKGNVTLAAEYKLDGSTINEQNKYAYNARGYITLYERFTGSSSELINGDKVVYTYDLNGLVTKRIIYNWNPDTKSYQDYVTSTYEYNSFGQIISTEDDEGDLKVKTTDIEMEKYVDLANPIYEEEGRNQPLFKSLKRYIWNGSEYESQYNISGKREGNTFTMEYDSAGVSLATDVFLFRTDGTLREEYKKVGSTYIVEYDAYNNKTYEEDNHLSTFLRVYEHTYSGSNLVQTISKKRTDDKNYINVSQVVYSDFQTFDIPTSTQSLSEYTGVTIYPCPSKGLINIDAREVIDVSILNLQGQVILKHQDASNYQIEIAQKGLYFLQIKHGAKISTKKIIIE